MASSARLSSEGREKREGIWLQRLTVRPLESSRWAASAAESTLGAATGQQREGVHRGASVVAVWGMWGGAGALPPRP